MIWKMRVPCLPSQLINLSFIQGIFIFYIPWFYEHVNVKWFDFGKVHVIMNQMFEQVYRVKCLDKEINMCILSKRYIFRQGV